MATKTRRIALSMVTAALALLAVATVTVGHRCAVRRPCHGRSSAPVVGRNRDRVYRVAGDLAPPGDRVGG
jgi:hypothetical protein